jgi:hypothetical protein
MVLKFRDALRDKSPRWLQRGNAGRLLYALGVHIDAFADALLAGIRQRFPGAYSYDSLPELGRERRIRRGRIETDPVYATRLARWLDDHRRRGGPYALLSQLHAHFAPANFPIDLLYYPSALLGGEAQRYRLATDGTITRDTVAWLPDDDAEHWARWWLVFSWPDAIAGDGFWDGPGEWDPDPEEVQPLGVWDSDLSLQDVIDLRVVPREWNAAHALGYLVLLAPGTELWDYPEGIWDEGGLWGDVEGDVAAIVSVDG